MTAYRTEHPYKQRIKYKLDSRRQSGHRDKTPFYKKKYFVALSIIFSLSLVLAMGVSFYNSYLKAGNFPVSSVEVLGELHYLDQDGLYSTVEPEIINGFFALNVNNIKQNILVKMPWAHKVIVRRAWPRRLIIRIEEHVPKAIWNHKGIINASGDLILPDLTNFTETLPVLIGPEDKLQVVWKQLMVYDLILASTGHKITRLELAQRGAWRLRLDNGMQVLLGTHEKEQRLRRFVKAYNQNLKKDQDAIAYVDMRYTTGMAVGWKTV